jgi:hypothetical protein
MPNSEITLRDVLTLEVLKMPRGGKRENAGRKKIEDPRDIKFMVRLTQTEKTLLVHKAQTLKMSVSEYLRHCALKGEE